MTHSRVSGIFDCFGAIGAMVHWSACVLKVGVILGSLKYDSFGYLEHYGPCISDLGVFLMSNIALLHLTLVRMNAYCCYLC